MFDAFQEWLCGDESFTVAILIQFSLNCCPLFETVLSHSTFCRRNNKIWLGLLMGLISVFCSFYWSLLSALEIWLLGLLLSTFVHFSCLIKTCGLAIAGVIKRLVLLRWTLKQNHCVIGYTCAFPGMTSKNVCRDRGLLCTKTTKWTYCKCRLNQERAQQHLFMHPHEYSVLEACWLSDYLLVLEWLLVACYLLASQLPVSKLVCSLSGQ